MSEYDPLDPVIIQVMLKGSLVSLTRPWLVVAWAGFDFERKPTPGSRSGYEERWGTIDNYFVRGFDHEDDAVLFKLAQPTSMEVRLIPNTRVQQRTAEVDRLRAENAKLTKKLGSVERRVKRMVGEVFGWTFS